MKHLLNNLSEEEKNSIREQHTEKIKIDATKFKPLMEGKLGNVKPIVNEQQLSRPEPNQDMAKSFEEIKKCVQENASTVPFLKQIVDFSAGNKFSLLDILMNQFNPLKQKVDIEAETKVLQACLKRKGLDPSTMMKNIGLPKL